MQIFSKKVSKKLRAAKKQLSRSGYSVIFSVIIGRWTIFPLPPEAARHPEQILRKHKAQYADVEVARIPRRTRLRFRIGKSANGAEGEPYHHAAPDQVGENVPEGAVERQQRKAECRRKPCPAAVETAFLRCGERRLQNAQKNYARHPAELRHIKDARRGIEQQQIQRPVECAESKAAVEAQQQEIRLPAAFPVGDT